MLRVLLLVLAFPFLLRADPAIHRGINLGNGLEAPKEGGWGVVLQEDYFSIIHKAGFDTIRVPVDWLDHAGPAPDYTIDPAFFARIDWVFANASKNALNVVIDYRADDALLKEPNRYTNRYLTIWKQIAERYRSQPDSVCFELLNEPHDPLSSAKWNALVVQVIPVIRASNPARCLVVGPLQWNSFNRLPDLQLPDDPHLLVTFHYYLPLEFTHQGASWIGPESKKWQGTKWEGTDAQRESMRKDFAAASDWAKSHHRPLYLGEFGAFEKGDMDSRCRWTACCARTAESFGIGWTYWEFCAGFGAYDPIAHTWRAPLLNVLMPPNTK